eukprot:TRINITY_DN15609_c0_g1_i1.p1 TRINITY_DN15609_c0_g1~~TRINITY_DN15609_c0_g1_i1.p1  ORF type:complete len:470 (+),score=141.67 TRINITY_DN15609_c0_g1_i1:61-1410(+)
MAEAQQKRTKFFQDIRAQKLPGIRYAFGKRFVNLVTTTDDEGLTALQIATQENKPKALKELAEHLARFERGALDTPDDDGLTPLMVSAQKGYAECVKVLVLNGARKDARSHDKKTALDYAKENKHQACVDLLMGKIEADDADEAEDEDPAALAREAARIRDLKLAKKAQSAITPGQAAATPATATSAAATTATTASTVAPAATWPEVATALKENKPQLTIQIESLDADATARAWIVDPALWFCHLNTLVLRMPAGVLTTLPSDIARLAPSLTSLTLAHNALTALPEEIGALVKLKQLLLEENQLIALPESMGKLAALEVFNVAGNQLQSLAPLQPLTNLVSVVADRNQLTVLELPYANLGRLVTLSACRNAITEVSDGIGLLQKLGTLNLADNQIAVLPREMGDLSEKKLLSLQLDNNPIADARVVKILQKGRAPIKELLMHLRKGKKH